MLLNLRTSNDHIRVCLLSVVYAAALFTYSAASSFEFDACDMPDNSHGICRVFQECLAVVDELRRGQISIDDPTRCGFKGNDELICCPTEEAVVTRTTTPWIFDNSREVRTSKSGDVWESGNTTEKEATTTAKPDFWLHLLDSSTTTTTTSKPDFWLHLLDSSTTTTTTTTKPDFWLHLLNTTTTTTPKPLVIGDQELDNNSQFYDFSKLLQPALNGGSSQTNFEANSLKNQKQTPISIQQVAEGNGNVLVQLQGNDGGGVFGNGRGPRDKFSTGNGFENGVENNVANDRSGNGFGFGRGRGRGQGRASNVGNGFVNGPGRGNGNGFVNGPGRGNGNGFVNRPGRGNGAGKGFGDRTGNGIGFGNGRSRNSFGNVFGNDAVNIVNQFPDSIWQSPQGAPVLNTFPVQNHNTVSPNQAQVEVLPQQPQQPIIFVENVNPMIYPSADPNFGLLDSTWNNQNNEAIHQNILNPTAVLAWPQTLVVNPAPAEAVQTIFTNSGVQSEALVFPTEPNPPTLTTVNKAPPTTSEFSFHPQTDVNDNSIDNVGKAAEDKWVWSISNNASPTRPRATSNTNSRTRPTTTPTTTSTSTTKRTSISPAVRSERPAVAACRVIEQNLSPFLTPHILDGTPVAPGEYPHMAAIGYSAIGEEGGPYDFRCGGTLIHERFVLTAAHCVNSRNVTPAIVRLGMADFDDPDEIPNRQEIPIKMVHIHDNYSSRRKYDDIALLELQRAAKFSTYVYPTCLYANPDDPPRDSRLYVTGWGTVNTTTRVRSGILLKAQLQIEPLDNCNSSYVEFGLTRQLNRGVLKTQLCARDPGFTKDACQGDSGGPLNMVIDESTKSFRVVGVISTGFGCASSIPGLYTRVSAYLDFIENIVWPLN